MKKEFVVLVDSRGRAKGRMEKIKAHKLGILHKAFSIFVFNEKGELLLQQRASSKYHFPGIWSNTVCSHPRSKELLSKAVHRKLKQELGFDTKLKKAFRFVYKVFDKKSGLWEHELDEVFIGFTDENKKIKPNKKEVKAVRWISVSELNKSLKKTPGKYSYWFKIALKKMKKKKLIKLENLHKFLNKKRKKK